MARSFEMDLTKGPLLKQIILYSLPIVGVNILQVLFNAVDVAVLGIFASDAAVGAVGATTHLINLIIGFFVGLTVSANVFVARYKGAGDKERANRFISTAFTMGIIFGIALIFVGWFGARTFLTWMDCPESLIDMATTYLQIYFLGMPLIILYNFCASILRAVGDTLRPLIFLAIGGVLNIGLNIFFITVLGKDVEGVAIATVASQGFSAIMSIIVLVRGKGFAKLNLKKLWIYKQELLEILRVGVPTGLQRCMFSISNVVMASTLNGFGDVVVTANTIAHQFDNIVHNVAAGFAVSSMAFVSQNLGARNYKRIWESIWKNLLVTSIVGFGLGVLAIIFAAPLCDIMTDSEEVIRYGVTRLNITCWFYVFCGIYSVFANVLHALKKAFVSMIGVMACTVGFRLIFVWTIFPLNPTIEMYYATYVISWVLCAVVMASIALPLMKKNQRNYEKRKAEEQARLNLEQEQTETQSA